MDFDIDIDGWPADVEWDALTVRAHAALGTVEPALHNPRLTASVLFTSDADVHALNKEWRGKDKPTNVLSFPMLEREDLLDLAPEVLINAADLNILVGSAGWQRLGRHRFDIATVPTAPLMRNSCMLSKRFQSDSALFGGRRLPTPPTSRWSPSSRWPLWNS